MQIRDIDEPTEGAQEEFYRLNDAYGRATTAAEKAREAYERAGVERARVKVALDAFLLRDENLGKSFRVFSDELIENAFSSEVEEFRFGGDENLWEPR